MASLKENSKSPKPQKIIQPILLVCEDSDGAVSYLQDRIASAKLTSAKVERLKVNVTILGGKGQHDYLVKQAITSLDANVLTAQQNLELPYDTVYCVMDYDVVWQDKDISKNALLRANELVKLKNLAIQAQGFLTQLVLIVSNDCFELWYLLHFCVDDAEIKSPLLPLYRSGVKNDDGGGKIGRKLWEKLGNIDGRSYSADRYEKLVKNKTSPIFSLMKEKGGSEEQAIKNAEKIAEIHLNNHPPNEAFLLFLYNPSTNLYLLFKKLAQMEAAISIR